MHTLTSAGADCAQRQLQKGQQETKQVQLFVSSADAGTAGDQHQHQQLPIPDTAAGSMQRLSKVTSIFKAKSTASKQVVSADGGNLAPQSGREAVPGDLIPAVRQSSDVVQQVDTPPLATTAENAAETATQVSPMPLVCNAVILYECKFICLLLLKRSSKCYRLHCKSFS